MKDYGVSAPHRPFQCFMGQWEGLCKTFSPEGVFIEAAAVHMDVYWAAPDVWHLHEHFDNLYEFGEQIYDSDFKVVGKVCASENALIKATGVELTPYNYNFVIESHVSKTTVYNNHYFLDPNNRRIITHKVRNGQTHIFQIQDFARVWAP